MLTHFLTGVRAMIGALFLVSSASSVVAAICAVAHALDAREYSHLLLAAAFAAGGILACGIAFAVLGL